MERLKWEFYENKERKRSIYAEITRREEEAENRRRHEEYVKKLEEKRKREAEYIKLYGGGYCGWNCKHYYERWLDSGGGITGSYSDWSYSEYYCSLGHSLCEGSYCEDFE